MLTGGRNRMPRVTRLRLVSDGSWWRGYGHNLKWRLGTGIHPLDYGPIGVCVWCWGQLRLFLGTLGLPIPPPARTLGYLLEWVGLTQCFLLSFSEPEPELS